MDNKKKQKKKAEKVEKKEEKEIREIIRGKEALKGDTTIYND